MRDNATPGPLTMPSAPKAPGRVRREGREDLPGRGTLASNWQRMVPAAYQPFFLASVGASAGLIGLLFVSVSIAPERVFGTKAEATRQAQALSAFTALVNIFFTSMTSLIPDVRLGVVVVIVTVPSVLQTLSLLALVPKWRAEGGFSRGLFALVASLAVYGLELAVGVQLWAEPANTGSLAGLLELLLGAYAIGLGRAWELLGAPRMGTLSSLVGLIEERLTRKPKS